MARCFDEREITEDVVLLLWAGGSVHSFDRIKGSYQGSQLIGAICQWFSLTKKRVQYVCLMIK